MWSLLGPRPVDVFHWESFGKEWYSDITNELKLKDVNNYSAGFGDLPDLSKGLGLFFFCFVFCFVFVLLLFCFVFFSLFMSLLCFCYPFPFVSSFVIRLIFLFLFSFTHFTSYPNS